MAAKDSASVLEHSRKSPVAEGKTAEEVSEKSTQGADDIIVDFEEGSLDNPLNWSSRYKWSIVVATSLLSALGQLATVVAAPAAPEIIQDFHSTNNLYRTLLVSIWEIGEAIGPLIFGPLSELYGRAPILNICNGLFVIFLVGCALSKNIHMLIAFRFLSGATVAASAICPGIIGDIFTPADRGKAMSVMTFASLVGPAIGPIIGSYLAQHRGWRWDFWISTILAGAVALLVLLVYRESYKVVLLRRKAWELRKLHPNTSRVYRSKYEPEEVTATKKFRTAICRPLVMLATSPILLSMVLYVSASNGFTYLVLTVISPVFQSVYGFSEGAAGIAFLGIVLGLAIGSIFCNYLLQWYFTELQKHDRELTPEIRLPPAVVSGLCAPIGFLLFGWTAQYHVQWMAPIVGTAIIGFAYIAVSLSTRVYLVDAFGIHAISAISAGLVLRNLTAALLPLAAPPLYRGLGYGWGNSVLALVAGLMIPIPLVLMKFGAVMRKRGRYKVIE